MSHRIEKVESTLRRAVSEVLQRRIADPRIEGVISITRVQVSPDMRDAYIYVSVIPESKQKRVINGLHHAAGHIRTLVSKAVALKTIPRLEFRLDDALKTQAEVYDAIRRGMDRTGLAPEGQEPGATPPDDTPQEPDSTR